MYLSEALPPHVGQWVEIYCSDGGSSPSCGILSSIGDALLVLERNDKIIQNKSYIAISKITRFSVYPNYKPDVA